MNYYEKRECYLDLVWDTVGDTLELVVTLCEHGLVTLVDQLFHVVRCLLVCAVRLEPVLQVAHCLAAFETGQPAA